MSTAMTASSQQVSLPACNVRGAFDMRCIDMRGAFDMRGASTSEVSASAGLTRDSAQESRRMAETHKPRQSSPAVATAPGRGRDQDWRSARKSPRVTVEAQLSPVTTCIWMRATSCHSPVTSCICVRASAAECMPALLPCQICLPNRAPLSQRASLKACWHVFSADMRRRERQKVCARERQREKEREALGSSVSQGS